MSDDQPPGLVPVEDPRREGIIREPHPLCLPQLHRSGWVAGNSVSELSHLTDGGRIALWVHGHVHHTVALQRPGGTRIVCNPAGPGFANPWFREDLVATV